MLIVVLACSICFVFSALLVPVFKRQAIRSGHLDHPDGVRKMHVEVVPNTGGIAVASAVGLTVFLTWAFVSNFPEWVALPSKYFWLGAIVLVITGLIDDKHGIKAWKKLVIQLLCSLLVWSVGYRITFELSFLGDYAVFSEVALSAIITIGWVTLMINAINLIDGLDGLASGVSIIGIAFLVLISPSSVETSGLLLFLYVGSALIGFLIYNRFPATVFLGDTGSMFVGYILGVSALATLHGNQGILPLVPAVLILGMPLLEVSLTILRRIMAKQPVFWSDSDHIHHRLEKRFSHKTAVDILYACSFSFGLAGLSWKLFPSLRIITISIVLMALFVGCKSLGYPRRES